MAKQRDIYREEARLMNPEDARIVALNEAKTAGLFGKERDNFLRSRIPEIVDESMRPSTQRRRPIWRR